MAMHPARQAYVEEGAPDDMQMEGIDYASLPTDHNYTIPTEAGGVKASVLLEEFDRKRRAAALAVPTADAQIKAQLRARGEPITLFGEGPGDRRDRLRELMLVEQENQNGADTGMLDADAEEEGEPEQEFYTRASNDLIEARKAMKEYSAPRTKDRLAFQKLEANIPLKTHVKHRNEIKEHMKGFDLYGTQIPADRPINIVRFSPNGEYVAVGHMGGGIKLLNVPNMEEVKDYRGGHADRTTGIAWRPGATLPGSDVSESSLNFASGGGGGNIRLWSLDKTNYLDTLAGHTDRVCRVEFHPSARYLASASYDCTWRLWDVEKSTELQMQEGHAKEVYAVSFNQDGSLVASGGLDSYARIWDIRTGRTIFLMEGHIKPIYALDWGTDGYRVLSGSGDGFVRCWDLRRVTDTNAIGGNSGGVTDLRWFKGTDGPTSGKPLQKDNNGDWSPKKASTFFVTSGFDKNVQIFSADDWSLIKTLKGHSGNILSTDVTNDGRWICSGGQDRTVKLWARDDQEGI